MSGKSLCMAAFASAVTTGAALPGETEGREPGDVIASEFGGVAHLCSLAFDDEVQPVESVATGREDAMRVAREILGFALAWAGAEVQGAVQPDSQQRRDMRTTVRTHR